MEKFIVEGGKRLTGTVRVSGSKNSALGILVAAALADGECLLHNVPDETDIRIMIDILIELGVRVEWLEANTLRLRTAHLRSYQAPYELVRRMRASFYVAGLLLARVGKAEVPLPGGCSLGSRPVDFHLKGFQALGADVSISHGLMKAEATRLIGTKIYINRSSVGTTVNLMLAASLAEGQTILENAAKEPEVVDLAIFLNGMGARIKGAGTNVIKIDGVKKLSGTEYTIIPDRVEAGTLMIATACTRGDVVVEEVVPEHLRAVVLTLQEAGVTVEEDLTRFHVVSDRRPKAVDTETAPYPGFPTDLQQPFVALMSTADGTSIIRETIFDRFRYVDELRRMGADIKVERDTAIVRGVERLTGAPVEVTDLRAGAALLCAALGAEGATEMVGVEHIDRGYERIDQKLRALGARITRFHAEGEWPSQE
ncbi:MAG: UDP-N-acetylglucosamine 1-carboxyvinyltransferase [Bacillota bacterium]|nr:UDP-N-acetylglucosamine 1-carboxyvinyltransferase [Bacillota bacterium]